MSRRQKKRANQHKILIVDDEQFNINALLIILQYKVGIDSYNMCDQAKSGEDAIKLIKEDLKRNNFKKTTYNIIFMDCNMPEMDGYDATHKIRSLLYKHKVS